jgi:ABC-type Na+ efflux pump permease subunit
MQRQLQFSGILLIVALVIEALSLCWNNTLAFMSFAVLGGMFFASGMLLFLYSLVSSKTSASDH